MEMTLGNRITMLRKEKELKQDQLAEMLNISPQAISKWENNQTCPDISLLPQLAKILGVTVDELLTGASPKQDIQLVPVEQRKNFNELILRITAHSKEGDKVRINLPMPLVQASLDMGMALPQVSGNPALSNIDLAQIVELVHQGVLGNLMEAESAEGDIVSIRVE